MKIIIKSLMMVLLISSFAFAQNATYYYNRGVSAYEKGEYDEAIRDYSRAIELKPNDADYFNNRGLCYKRIGNNLQAISDFNRATAIDPGSVDAYFNLGYLYALKGDFPSAIKAYNEVLRLDSRDYETYFNLALIYHRNLKNEKEARKQYEKFLRFFKESATQAP